MSARKKKSSIGLSIVKPLGAVIVLTAFILTISLLVKGVSQLNTGKVLSTLQPFLAKLNINVEDSMLGEVAGSISARISNTDLSGGGSIERIKNDTSEETDYNSDNTFREVSSTTSGTATSDVVLLKIALLADSHSDYPMLKEALSKVKALSPSAIFFLGDYTELGLLEDLTEAKNIMNSADLPYYSLPGDHDLWKSVGPQYFDEVFDDRNQVYKKSGVKFVLLDNSANYTAISSEDLSWFEKEVTDADFVVLSQPLYSSKLDRYMGKVNGEEVAVVLEQRNQLLNTIRKSNVRAVISADLHSSGTTADPDKNNLLHVQVGALARERNLQTPRFSTITVFDDISFEVEDVMLE